MKRTIFLLGVGLLVVTLSASIIFYRTQIVSFYKTYLSVHSIMSDIRTNHTGTSMSFEMATTTAAQERGLSGRSVIPNNYAMVFVFPRDDRYGFWMKDMLVLIDIIWLSDNGTIINIENSVQPDTYPHVFYPPKPARYVLETRAGFALARGWHIGSIVKLPR